MLPSAPLISVASWPPSPASAWDSSPMLSVQPPLGWGMQAYAETLSVCDSKQHQGRPTAETPRLILPMPPPQEIKISCPRGSAPSSEQIQHIQTHSPRASGRTDALPPAPRPHSSPASSNTGSLRAPVSSLAETGQGGGVRGGHRQDLSQARGKEGQENGHWQS